MHIHELYGKGRPVLSIEIFPPKTDKGMASLKAWLAEAAPYRPGYVSVTYGAGGGTRENTHHLCAHILQTMDCEAMAHLTCVSHTRGHVEAILDSLKAKGIQNIMALRGDPPAGEAAFEPPPGGYRHAVELVRAIAKHGQFTIGVAGYPEGHAEAPSYAADLEHQIAKIQAGAHLVVSQFFLDNAHFFRWREDLSRAGVGVPVIPGVMPAQSLQQIARFAGFCGVSIPEELRAGLSRFRDDPAAAAKFGIEYCQRQVGGLLAAGVDGIHLYALNKIEPVEAIAPMVGT
jgi:methylenetetrahydrofolate reductase (NADPH)